MSKLSRQRDLRAVHNLIVQAQAMLAKKASADVTIENSLELLRAASELTDGLITLAAVEKPTNRSTTTNTAAS
jgi:hypothetical protein